MVSPSIRLALVAAIAPSVLAFPAFVDNIPNGKAFGKALGHGDNGYTPFGELFKGENKTWPEICDQAWPGQTGVTVGAALGDPCCKWKSGPPGVVLSAPALVGTVCKDGVAIATGGEAETPTASPPILIAKAPVASIPAASPPILIARAPTAVSITPASVRQTASKSEVLCEAA